MLTQIEEVKIRWFARGMDENTAAAMRDLFIAAKPGNVPEVDMLIAAAHHPQARASQAVVNRFQRCGLVNFDGTIPDSIQDAICMAVGENYLAVKGYKDPQLTPDLQLFPA